jgi:hypothetical protein
VYNERFIYRIILQYLRFHKLHNTFLYRTKLKLRRKIKKDINVSKNQARCRNARISTLTCQLITKNEQGTLGI